MPHARRYEPQRADLLVALGRGVDATRRRLDGVWSSLDQGLLTSAEIAVRDIAVLARRVGDATSAQHSQVADIVLRLYANPLAAVPDAGDLSIGSPADAARLLALAGETALAADNTEWLSPNAGRLLSVASDAGDVKVAVRLRILAAEGSSDWAAVMSEARATRLGFDLGGLVTARHARHQALHGRFAEADASWDEAAGSACLVALEVLDAARDGSLIDLVEWAGSRYLGAIAALAGIVSRVSPDRAERCLAYFEEQPEVEPGHYRFHLRRRGGRRCRDRRCLSRAAGPRPAAPRRAFGQVADLPER